MLGVALLLCSPAGGLPAIAGDLCAGVIAGPSALSHVAPALSGWLFPASVSQLYLLDAQAISACSCWSASPACRSTSPWSGGGRQRRHRRPRRPGSLSPASGHTTAFILFAGALGVSAIPVIAKTLADLRLIDRSSTASSNSKPAPTACETPQTSAAGSALPAHAAPDAISLDRQHDTEGNRAEAPPH